MTFYNNKFFKMENFLIQKLQKKILFSYFSKKLWNNFSNNLNKESFIKKKIQNLQKGSLMLIYFYTLAKGKYAKNTFSGFVMKKKKNQYNTTATIRKTHKYVGFTINFAVFSPIILDFKIIKQHRKIKRKELKKLKSIF